MLGKGLLIVLLLTLSATPVMSAQKADAVLVIKKESRLYLLSKGETFASYHVTFGGQPVGAQATTGR